MLDESVLLAFVAAGFLSLVVAAAWLIIIKRIFPVDPIPVKESWRHFDQRRYYRPGAFLRALAAIVVAFVLMGGSVASFWFVDVSAEWLVGLCFAALTASVVAASFIMRRKDRCPLCNITAMERDYVAKVRILVCTRCEVIWHTSRGDPHGETHNDPHVNHHHF